MPLPIEEAWKLMLDVPRILPCLPGAKLTEVVGPDKYRGAVAVKLGPVKLGFEGQAELVKQDDQAHIAWLKGAGLDPKGRGAAQSEFSFALQPSGSGTDVTVTTQLQLTGAVAQYGRGSGMIAEVASQILGQFEENLAEMLLEDRHDARDPAQVGLPARPAAIDQAIAAAMDVGQSAGAVPAHGAPTSPDAQVVYHQAQAILAQSQAVLAATQQALAEFRRASPAPARKSAKKKELNGFAILWRAMWANRKQAAVAKPD
ncbi:SRPBCC family protein [Ramlibacter aurantiacus]|uniref:SRPBCC family protein n=1 Tax=Ramlibacter aurantiacus TaxID=2801330 RepID=UPI003390653D